VSTGVGIAISRDGGRTWTLRPAVSAREAARAEHRLVYVDFRFTNLGGTTNAFVTPDGGQTWRRLRPPPPLRYDMGGVAFADPRHGLIAAGQEGIDPHLPVYATDDGGRHWRIVSVPRRVRGRRVARDSGIGLGPDTIFIPNAAKASRARLGLVSVDDGRHWLVTTVRPGYFECAASRPIRATIWLSCGDVNFREPTLLLVTHDGGTSWQKVISTLQLDAGIHVVGEHEAWAIGRGATLWHTMDDGRHWREVWVRIPASARVFQMEHGPIMG
jgi:photosystem II stability/assembly factor-like uncharacterized protein